MKTNKFKSICLRLAEERYKIDAELRDLMGYPAETFEEWLDTEITEKRYTIGNKKSDRAYLYIARNEHHRICKELNTAIAEIIEEGF